MFAESKPKKSILIIAAEFYALFISSDVGFSIAKDLQVRHQQVIAVDIFINSKQVFDDDVRIRKTTESREVIGISANREAYYRLGIF